MNNFKYALNLAQMLYDVEITDEDDALEIGLVAYNKIGNKNTKLIKDQLYINSEGFAELPCNCDIIEAITYDGVEDWNYTSNIKNNGDFNSLRTELYIENQKQYLDPFYISGKYVKYKRVGNKIYTNKGIGKINILYHGIVLDEEGLPEINDKEANAIALYIAYVNKYKEAIKTNNKNLMQMALDLKQSWLFHCDQARVAEYVSQDEMNKILDTQTSWNRKVYGKSFKPVM